MSDENTPVVEDRRNDYTWAIVMVAFAVVVMGLLYWGRSRQTPTQEQINRAEAKNEVADLGEEEDVPVLRAAESSDEADMEEGESEVRDEAQTEDASIASTTEEAEETAEAADEVQAIKAATEAEDTSASTPTEVRPRRIVRIKKPTPPEPSYRVEKVSQKPLHPQDLQAAQSAHKVREKLGKIRKKLNEMR